MGMMAARVGGSEQGQLQGANNSLRAISELIGPSIFTLTFAYFIGSARQWNAPGAPFLLAAALLGSSVLLALGTQSVAQPSEVPAPGVALGTQSVAQPSEVPAPGVASAKTQNQPG